jgi:hypothetical protein
MKAGWDHVVPLLRQALAILRNVQKLTGHRRYVFSCSKDAPLSNNTPTNACGCLALTPRLIIVPTDSGPPSRPRLTTKGFKYAKAWDGDVVELQLAQLDNSTGEGLKKHGPLALIGSRTKLMQHWADRGDRWLNP